MRSHRVSAVLWLHTVVMGIGGISFFLFPAQSATLWPWALPPLAARFMGSLFLGGAVCSFVCLRAPDERVLFTMVLLAVGNAVIALSGLLGIGDIGFTAAMIRFLAFFVGVALLLALTVVPATRGAATAAATPIPNALRAFFLVHLLVVLPVGIAMLFLPSWAQSLWPWKMNSSNVRLIGSFFFGAAFISIWALLQRFSESLHAVLALYATFATLATIASLMHIGLFDTARVVTWAFFALYVFVAGGSSLLLWKLSSGRRKEASIP